jgi:hypothetical protein
MWLIDPPQSIADVIDNPNGLTAQEHGGAEEAYAALSSTYYSYAHPGVFLYRSRF